MDFCVNPSKFSFPGRLILLSSSPNLLIDLPDQKQTAVFHPELSDVDNSLIYGITGGVPHYINKLDVNKNVDEALLDNLFLQKMYS